ncbi:uncharacterized protein MELLADRAFT_105955 [Melampsora larici-populina 98AG31]|uniref:Uncharacterized protein n=1 Tax=Melampsora larici-populina (strain 98AG31 / pathotype 3-4-7) TaxID=747676 RepID=F4RJW4_MELLP|nr:uncharacterized protein MELLADRAFT_105955 [Melampsora larici-populina 98AG31]EGG07427.1 hypothetical protein MELLADRAFT_105955 [Melampsora larici-populina 98AG31]
MCRLNLDRSLMVPPRPPRLPTDELARPFDPRLSPSYTLPPPYILPSPSFMDTGVCNQISTCIRNTENPYSVSISPNLVGQLARQSTRLRPGRPPNTTCPGSGTSTPVLRMRAEDFELNRDRNRDAEQNKWWHWSRPCKKTGDANHSAYSPVRCEDLEVDDEDGIVTKCAIVCPLDGEFTHPNDKSKWRVKNGL